MTAGTRKAPKTPCVGKAAWVAVCAALMWVGKSDPVTAGDPELLLSCRHDPDDRILTLVCGRVEREAPGVAAAGGYGVTIIHGKAGLSPAPASGTRALDIQVTGTHPESQFSTKQVKAVLTGSYAPSSTGDWASEFTAEGAPRDLVHPVADALLERLEAFLATSPTD